MCKKYVAIQDIDLVFKVGGELRPNYLTQHVILVLKKM